MIGWIRYEAGAPNRKTLQVDLESLRGGGFGSWAGVFVSVF